MPSREIKVGASYAIDRQAVPPDPWTPLDIADCQFWFDATQLTGYSDGDLVDSLPDLSENADAVPDADANKAQYKINIQNSLPALWFGHAGIDDTYKLPALFTGTPTLSIFVVYRANNQVATQIIWSQGTGVGSDFVMQIGPGTWGVGDPALMLGDGAGVWTSGDIGLRDTWALVACRIDATKTGYSVVNGVPLGSGQNPIFLVPDTPVRISGFFNFGENNRLNGYIGEVIIYTPIISVANDALVTAYLLDKWGLP